MRDVRRQMVWPLHMRLADQPAQIGVARLVLGQQHQPVDRLLGAAPFQRADYAQGRADDRLHPGIHRRVAESHGGVKAVAVGQRHCGKAALGRGLRQYLGLDRAFQH
jgi:hypothetical protein